MGRPSLVAERTTEILDAFERCIVRFGIEGSSLERIAEEADMKRSILRHYVGNRDDLVAALADRVTEQYRELFDDYVASHSDLQPVEQLMGFLFPAKALSTAQSLWVLESLIAISASSPDIQRKMLDYVDGLVVRASAMLNQSYANASKKDCWTVAYGVVSICFNQESLVALEPPPKYARAAKAAAWALVRTLEVPAT